MFYLPLQMHFVSITFLRLFFTYSCMILIGIFPFKIQAVENVDIAIFYTEQAQRFMPVAALHRLLERRTQIANLALKEANLPLQRRIVAFEPSPIGQDVMRSPELFLSDRDFYQDILPHMEIFGADYVTIVAHLPAVKGCGRAQVGGRVSIVLVSGKCNKKDKDYLLAHEWGHLL